MNMLDVQYSINDRKDFPITTGIYLITFKNSQSGRVYVGSASFTKRKTSRGFKNRWNIHLSDLKRGKHHSIKLQRAYDKYGIENIIFQVIEVVEPNLCLTREKIYITQYNSFKNGYNMSDGVTSHNLGRTMSQESRLKMSQKSHMRGKFNEKHHLSKPVFQYDLLGVFVKKWESSSEPERQLTTRGKLDISAAIRKNGSAGGFLWSRTYLGERISVPKGIFKNIGKLIGMFDLDNNLIKTFETQVEAANFLQVKKQGINNALLGKTKTAHKYKWKFLNN